MSKLNLPIHLISINTVNPEKSLAAIKFSEKFIKFEKVTLFSNLKSLEFENVENININKFKSINQYSDFVLGLNSFVSSDFVLIIQDDGHILNNNKWSSDFLKYDYIGAPWPSSNKWIKRFEKYGDSTYKIVKENIKFNRVGNGGFSLRSKKFLEYTSGFQSCNNFSEDIFLCLLNFEKSREYNIKFPSVQTSLEFSYETPLKGYKLKKEAKNVEINIENHFGWHGKKFTNTSYLLNLKNSS